MAEKRKKTEIVCVKTSAKTVLKIELFAAEQWDKSAQGLFRVLVNRCWHNLPDGTHAYLTYAQAMQLVATLRTGGASTLPAEPVLPYATCVSAPNGRVLAGQIQRDITRTVTPPILGYDAKWHVGVLIIDKGCVMVPVADIIIKD